MFVFGVKELSQRISKVVRDYLYPYGETNIIVRGVIKHDKNSKTLQLKASPKFGYYLTFTLVDKDESDVNDPKHTINVWQGGAKMIDGLQYGVEVEISGTVTISAKNSNYYLSAKQITIVDENAIKHILSKRKEEFEQKGYFIKSKQPYQLKRNPKKIGIITSKDGSVIHDMHATLNTRYPLCDIVLYSCGVQGDDSVARNIAHGIRTLDNLNLDAIVVARGGGSAQDLMVFSSEIVVKAIHESKTYIVSAVGHQDDHPLCDLAANWRSATPTASINDIVVHSKEVILNWLENTKICSTYLHNIVQKKSLECGINVDLHKYLDLLQSRIYTMNDSIIKSKIDSLQINLKYFTNNISNHYKYKIGNYSNVLVDYGARQINYDFREYFAHIQSDLKLVLDIISAYSHEKVLKRGFCLVIGENSTIITSKSIFDDSNKNRCKIRFADGECNL